MKRRTVLILGGALAGPTAAARARELDEHARIVLIERNRRISYAECGLAYHLSGEVAAIEDLDRERADFFESVYAVEVWTGAEATAIDPTNHRLTVNKGGHAESVAYDALVVALGAASRLPDPLPPTAANLVCFRTLDDLETIDRTLASGAKRVTVIGGGPIGIEAADGLLRSRAEVTIIERQPRLLNTFGPRVAGAARQALEPGARVFTNAAIGSCEMKAGQLASLTLSTGERIETDLVISAIGLLPRTDLLRAAGAKLADNGTAVVDNRCQTSLPDVLACGVCVSVPQVVTGGPVWWPQGALADKTAQVAGATATGAEATLAPALGSMLIRVSDSTIGRTGLSRVQAEAHFGVQDVAITTVFAPSHDRYYPDSDLVLVQTVWRRSDGQLLGVEAAGTTGVDKRIDSAAAAIAAGLSVERLAALDFGYEPPYSAARDPLNVAAAVASFERAGVGRSVEPEELAARDGIQVVDVRADSGLPALDGSIWIPLERLRQELQKLDRAWPVVTVSESGRRGWLAARILSQNGFADVANLAGGLRGWALSR